MTAEHHQKKLDQVLAFNRNEVAEPLSVSVPVHALIDKSYCLAVKEALATAGQEWQTFTATPNVADLLPNSPGLYMFLWEPFFGIKLESGDYHFKWCLYVGKAEHTTIRNRYKNEYQAYVQGDPAILYKEGGKSRKEMLQKYLCLQPLRIWCLEINEVQLIDPYERKLIDILNPPLNTHGKLRGRLATPEKAF